MATTTETCCGENSQPSLPEYIKIECVHVPAPGEPPLMIFSGNETYQEILNRVKVNSELSRSANVIYVQSLEIVDALRSLAHLINLPENLCDETKPHLEEIQRMVKIAETNTDLAFKVSRVKLQVAGSENHQSIKTQLAVASIEVEAVREELKESIQSMAKVQKLKKVIEDSGNFGNDILGAKSR